MLRCPRNSGVLSSSIPHNGVKSERHNGVSESHVRSRPLARFSKKAQRNAIVFFEASIVDFENLLRVRLAPFLSDVLGGTENTPRLHG